MLTRYVRPPLACANIGVILMGIGALALTVNLGLTAYAAEPLVERIDQLEAKSFSQEKAARILEEEGLVPIWDRLNAATPTGRFDVFTNIGIEFLTLGREAARQTYDHDIEEVKFFEGGQRIDAAAWGQLLQGLKMQGYEITHSDWHQERYETNKDGSPVSDTRFTIQGRRNGGQDRMEVKATARITWRKAGGTFFPARVEVMDGKIRRRSAPPAFAQRLRLNLAAQDAPPQLFENSDDGSFCAYDLNGDQLPEIIMASHDKILWNRGNWKFDGIQKQSLTKIH